jgi:hypothetical protein
MRLIRIPFALSEELSLDRVIRLLLRYYYVTTSSSFEVTLATCCCWVVVTGRTRVGPRLIVDRYEGGQRGSWLAVKASCQSRIRDLNPTTCTLDSASILATVGSYRCQLAIMAEDLRVGQPSAVSLATCGQSTRFS